MLLLNKSDSAQSVTLVSGGNIVLPPLVISDIGTRVAATPLPSTVVVVTSVPTNALVVPLPSYPTFPFLGMTISGVSGVGIMEYWDGTAWQVLISGKPNTGAPAWKMYDPLVPIQSLDMIMVDTSLTPVTVTLPAGILGESIGFLDMKGTFATNSLTIRSTGGATFMATPSPLIHAVSRTIILTATTNDWRF